MKFYLIVAKGKKQGMPIPIEVDLFVIGSDRICQLRAEHPQIGKQHCALVMRDRKVFVRDLNSGLPTVVNGDALQTSQEWPLHAGDLIQVGPLKFMIQYREKAASQRDLEEWALRCLDADSQRKIPVIEQLDALSPYARQMEDASKAAGAILERMSAKRGIVQGRLRIARENGIIIIRVNDVYLVDEAELALLKKELHDQLSKPNLRVLIDLKNVRRMSSAAAEMFADLVAWLRPWGSRMAVCRLRPQFLEVMQTQPALEGVRFFNDKQTPLAGKW